MQWREAVLVTSVGASGGFDADGRPSVYRRALRLLERRTIAVERITTHAFEGLPAVSDAFAVDPGLHGFVKAVVRL